MFSSTWIASQTRKLHIKHLWVVLELLVQNGLVLNLDKCSFLQHKIEYLGHEITVDGIVPPSCHVDALLLQPQDVCGLQRFLGMINFYCSFLPGIARTLRPLTDALAGNLRVLHWSQEFQDAFDRAKSARVSHCHSSLMPPTHMWVQLYSRKSWVVGAPSPSSLPSSLPHNRGTLLSIENS